MIELKGQIEGVSTRKDRTVKITFGTQELRGKDAAKLLDLQNELVTLGIAEKGLTDKEIQTLQEAKSGLDDVPNGKSSSQRLRGALYVYYTQNETPFDDFQLFYNNYIEKIINNVKSKLEP